MIVAIVAVGIYAFNQKRENGRLANELGLQYASKMADASKKLEELNIAVNKTLLFNEAEAYAKPREDIWRLTSDIKASISSLPMDHKFSTSWLNYLGRLGNYAKEAQRLGDDHEYHRVMSQASENLAELTSEWQVATANMVSGQLSVNEWKQRLSAETTKEWDGMGTMAKQYSESDFPLTASESDAMKKKELQSLEDAEVNDDEAIEIFKKLFPNAPNRVIGIEKSQPGSPYPFYHIRFADKQTVGYIDITKKGGHVLSYLAERAFGKEQLEFQQLLQKTEKFLKDAGYHDVVFEEARENNTSWHIVFVRIEPIYGAKVFSDVIHVKVAKDNGDMIGLDASEYIRKEKTKQQPIKTFDWNTFFHSNVKVQKEQLAFVENDLLEQRLAYHLTVTMTENGSTATYIVVVDTETGKVIQTDKMG